MNDSDVLEVLRQRKHYLELEKATEIMANVVAYLIKTHTKEEELPEIIDTYVLLSCYLAEERGDSDHAGLAKHYLDRAGVSVFDAQIIDVRDQEEKWLHLNDHELPGVKRQNAGWVMSQYVLAEWIINNLQEQA